MSEPIVVTLSPTQQAMLADIRTVIARAEADRALILRTVIGAEHAPDAPVWAWRCEIRDATLTLTPPAS